MDDVDNKMIFDGYKSLSDKVDEFDYKIKMIYQHIRSHRDALMRIDNKIDSLLEETAQLEDDCFLERDNGYCEMIQLINLVRQIMEKRNCNLHEIIKEIILNA